MTYAARLLNWGFAMDGKVRPVGVLVGPLPAHPAAQPAVHHPPARHKQRALPPPAKLGVPGIPLLASLVIAVVTRRGRRAESPAGGTAAGGSPAGDSAGGGGAPGSNAPGGSAAGGSPAAG